MDAMRTATDQYLHVHDGKVTHESVEEAWSKVAGICRTRRTEQSKPYIRALLYVRGILCNRVYVNEKTVIGLLEDAHLAGISIEYLQRAAKTCRNWTEFQSAHVRVHGPVKRQGHEVTPKMFPNRTRYGMQPWSRSASVKKLVVRVSLCSRTLK